MTIAMLDACVLYPPSLRDLLMRLAADEMFAPRWTDVIEAEWVGNVLANNPNVAPEKLARTCALMKRVDPDCVVSDYEAYIPILTLPDADDRHVLAAAIKANASVIVTYNLADFPVTELEAYDISPAHPDLFLTALFDGAPTSFLNTVRGHRSVLNNPAKSVQDYLDTLNVTGLITLAERIRGNRDAI